MPSHFYTGSKSASGINAAEPEPLSGFRKWLRFQKGHSLPRTIWLTAQGYLIKYTWWVTVLLVAEMLVDFACLLLIGRWIASAGAVTSLLAVLAVWLVMRYGSRKTGLNSG